MTEALRSLSYEGTIVYLHQNRLELLHVTHRLEDGEIHEQLRSLNGPIRTMHRERGQVVCDLSHSHPISVRGQDFKEDVFQAWTLNPDTLGDHYMVHSLGGDRVAGRQTEVIGIFPHDDLRYGYRFYLDTDTGLPLKSDLIGPDAEAIEQIMFATLNLLPSNAAQETAASRTRSEQTSRPPDMSLLRWRFDSMPLGFVVAMHDQLDGSGQPVEHFVLSDGLSSVSVYIESDPKEGLQGNARIGAVHAAGKRLAGYQITVVGEVPLKTVEAVLAGIRRAPGRSQ